MTKQGLESNVYLEDRIVRAIKYSLKKGRELARAHPEIVDEFRAGRYYKQIAEEYVEDFNKSPSTSLNIVRYALIELLGEEEVSKVAGEHLKSSRKISGKRIGRNTFEKGIGCFAMDSEERSELSRKIAKKMGDKYAKKNYKAGLGIAGMSKDERKDATRKGLIALGYAPSDLIKLELYCGYFNEREYVVHLKEKEGLSWKEITNKANQAFGEGRSLECFRTCYNNSWRTKNPAKKNNILRKNKKKSR